MGAEVGFTLSCGLLLTILPCVPLQVCTWRDGIRPLWDEHLFGICAVEVSTEHLFGKTKHIIKDNNLLQQITAYQHYREQRPLEKVNLLESDIWALKMGHMLWRNKIWKALTGIPDTAWRMLFIKKLSQKFLGILIKKHLSFQNQEFSLSSIFTEVYCVKSTKGLKRGTDPGWFTIQEENSSYKRTRKLQFVLAMSLCSCFS